MLTKYFFYIIKKHDLIFRKEFTLTRKCNKDDNESKTVQTLPHYWIHSFSFYVRSLFLILIYLKLLYLIAMDQLFTQAEWKYYLWETTKFFYLSSFHLLSCHPDYAQPPYHCKWLLIARRLLKPALEGCLESNLSRQLSTRASAPLSTKPRYLAKGEFEQFYMKQKWLHEKQCIIFFK